MKPESYDAAERAASVEVGRAIDRFLACYGASYKDAVRMRPMLAKAIHLEVSEPLEREIAQTIKDKWALLAHHEAICDLYGLPHNTGMEALRAHIIDSRTDAEREIAELVGLLRHSVGLLKAYQQLAPDQWAQGEIVQAEAALARYDSKQDHNGVTQKERT